MAAVTDWDRINDQRLKERLKEQYEYDCEHGIGAYRTQEKQECEELHQFFINFEKKNGTENVSVEFIGFG